jgi:hypothetical protein
VRKFANICEILDGESKSFSPAGQMPPMNKILQINIYIYIYACVMDAFKQEYKMVWENIYIYIIIAKKDIIHVHFTFLQIHSNDLIKGEKEKRK